MGPTLGVLALLAVAYGIFRLVRKPKKPYLACVEYFVYLPDESMPSFDKVMDRVIRPGDYGQPVSSSEGILFSDIRLHMALVLRSRNPHVFRCDNFDYRSPPSATSLGAVDKAKTLVKVRYLSEEPLTNKRHLQLLPYLAESVAMLGAGKVIFDVTAERLIDLEVLQAELHADSNASRMAMHLSVYLEPAEEGVRVCTKGFAKIGLPDLRTLPVDGDSRVLVLEVVSAAAEVIWEKGELINELEVEAFDDQFLVTLDVLKDPVELTIHRKRRL